ncbi:hypothetical protein BAE44_0009344, partial [Dichanthelium oligosanthes]
EVIYGREVQSSTPTIGFYWSFVATNEGEENIGEVAYNSILNLESSNPTMLLRIMKGNRYVDGYLSILFCLCSDSRFSNCLVISFEGSGIFLVNKGQFGSTPNRLRSALLLASCSSRSHYSTSPILAIW